MNFLPQLLVLSSPGAAGASPELGIFFFLDSLPVVNFFLHPRLRLTFNLTDLHPLPLSSLSQALSFTELDSQ